MKKIIVGVDGSELSLKAFERAVSDVACQGGEVIAVCVAEMLSTLSLKKFDDQAYERLLQHHRTILDEVLERGNQSGVMVKGVLESGRPASVLARLAREEKADEIVVGSQGKDAEQKMLLGHVSSRLIEIAPCSVVVVR
jgi:nucleotide-binding universal stress UspA family protein